MRVKTIQIFILLFTYTCGQPTCETAKHLTDRQSTSISGLFRKRSSSTLKDNTLTAGWYRVLGGVELANTPVPYMTCGTTFPIWAYGNFPSKGLERIVSGCVVSKTSNCEKSYPIKIKNCGKYNVFYLIPTELSNEAYCFRNITKDDQMPTADFKLPNEIPKRVHPFKYTLDTIFCLALAVTATGIIIMMCKTCDTLKPAWIGKKNELEK